MLIRFCDPTDKFRASTFLIFFLRELFYKTLAPLFIVALFTVTIVSPAPGRPNQMAGQDYATKGYAAGATVDRREGRVPLHRQHAGSSR